LESGEKERKRVREECESLRESEREEQTERKRE
jgi:hypothetical protein